MPGLHAELVIFAMRLWHSWSPFPGNDFFRPETKLQIGASNNCCAVSETKGGPRAPPIRGHSHAFRKSPQFADCLVAEAVVFESVSTRRFPASREKYSDFCKRCGILRPCHRIFDREFKGLPLEFPAGVNRVFSGRIRERDTHELAVIKCENRKRRKRLTQGADICGLKAYLRFGRPDDCERLIPILIRLSDDGFVPGPRRGPTRRASSNVPDMIHSDCSYDLSDWFVCFCR